MRAARPQLEPAFEFEEITRVTKKLENGQRAKPDASGHGVAPTPVRGPRLRGDRSRGNGWDSGGAPHQAEKAGDLRRTAADEAELRAWWGMGGWEGAPEGRLTEYDLAPDAFALISFALKWMTPPSEMRPRPIPPGYVISATQGRSGGDGPHRRTPSPLHTAPTKVDCVMI